MNEPIVKSIHSDKIKKVTVSAFKWVSLLQVSYQSSLFIVNIVLARILISDDFGLASLVTVITGVILTIVDMGFNAALIQKKETDKRDLSTAFFINLVMAFVLTIALISSASFIGSFFNKEALVPMLRLFSFVFIIRAFISVQMALCDRDLIFSKITQVTIISYFVGSIVKIFMALKGYGSWSIIIGEIATQIVMAMLFWIHSPFIPSIKLVNRESFNMLFSFGSKIMLTNLLNSLGHRIDTMIVGKITSSANLGVYSMSFAITSVIPSQINAIIQRVMFPSFSRIQDDDTVTANMYLKLARYISLISMPIAIGFIFVTPEFVRIFLTEKWVPAIPVIQILCIFAMTNSLGGVLWSQILKAKGLSGMVLIMSVITLIALSLVVVIGSRWGLIGVAWAIVVYGWLFRFILQHIVNKIIKISMMEYIRSILPSFLTTLPMAVCLFAIRKIAKPIIINDLILFFVLLIIGAIIYILSLRGFYKKDFMAFLSIVKSFYRRKNN